MIVICFGVIAISFGIGLLLIVFGLVMVRLHQGAILGNSIKVGPTSFPMINKIAEQAASDMGIQKPRVHVTQAPDINASAMGFARPYTIVVHSATIQALDEDELKFIIGHEMSHIRSNHTRWLSVVSPLNSQIPFFFNIFNFWSRRAEYTCDRAGLLFCQDVAAAIRAMIKVSCGADALKHTDMADFVRQAVAVTANPADSLGELLQEHPYATRRVVELLRFSKTAVYHSNQAPVLCSICGFPMVDADMFCSKCGAPRAMLPTVGRCSNCGVSVTAGERVCTCCGRNIESSPVSETCPKCRNHVPADSAYCTDCGTCLGDEKTRAFGFGA
jgi:Zn-dependent protease with chaperone function